MHGMSPDDELVYWRERAKRAETERDALQRGFVSDASMDSMLGRLAAERDALRAECERMRKAYENANEEYRTLQAVLKAEHEECQRLRAECERMRAFVNRMAEVVAASNVLRNKHREVFRDVSAKTDTGRWCQALDAFNDGDKP